MRSMPGPRTPGPGVCGRARDIWISGSDWGLPKLQEWLGEFGMGEFGTHVGEFGTHANPSYTSRPGPRGTRPGLGPVDSSKESGSHVNPS